MIIVLIVISIIIFILGCFVTDDCDLQVSMIGGSLVTFIINLGVLIYLLVKIIGLRVIDEKIELYQTQNEEIENKVEVVVKQYMEHENKTFTGLKTDESYITLVTLYPELKSDKLIEQEINLYEENNKKILELKEQKINEKIYKWWLYFGGNK